MNKNNYPKPQVKTFFLTCFNAMIVLQLFTALIRSFLLTTPLFKAKPATKVMLPLALTFGAYQGANAQTYGPKIQKYEINVVEDEQSETLGFDEKVTY